jgi:hypothetical protein
VIQCDAETFIIEKGFFFPRDYVAQIEIRKRPVVREEVRLRKDRVVEQRAAETEVRREEVDIEDHGTHRVRDGDGDAGIKKTNFGEDSGALDVGTDPMSRRDPGGNDGL